MKKIIYILLFLPVLTYGQSNRVKIIQDNTGVFRGSVPPSDTSLTWRNTTDGQSYFWSVENQAWTVVKFNYDFQSYADILGAEIPAGSIARDKYRKFWVQSDSTPGFLVDSLWTIPLASGYGYAIDERLINEQVIEITEDMIGDTTQNNYILEKASNLAYIMAQANKSSTIELPAKNIEYTNQLNIIAKYSGTGITLRGTGKSNNGTGRTTLNYTGTDSTALYISDGGNMTIENLSIIGYQKYIVFLDTFVFKVYFRDMDISAPDATTEAMAELNRNTTSQISEIYFDNCRFAAAGGSNLNPGDLPVERGISGGQANNKDLYVSECTFFNLDTAIHYSGGGILDMQKNNFANNFLDIFADGNMVFCSSNYSEAARQFYASKIFSGASQQTLVNNYFAGQPYNNIVIWGGGYLNLIGNQFSGATDSLNRIKWDITTNNNTILPTGSTNARKLIAIGNHFRNCTNTPGEKWLVNGSDIEPSNVSRMVRAWSNRGGTNDSNGVYLDDYFSFWETYSNGIEYDGSWSGTPGNNVLIDNAKLSIQNWGSGFGLAVGSSSTITPAIFTGLNGSISVGVNGRAQMDFNSTSGSMPRINLSENGTTNLFLGQAFTGQPTITSPVNNLTIFVDGNNDGVGNLYFRKGSLNGRTTDGTGLAILTNAGNLGIGTFTSVSEKLEVSGNCVIDGTIYLNTAKTVGIFTGTGDPEGTITASVGSTFHRTDGGASTTLYVKESGTGNTGWVAK